MAKAKGHPAFVPGQLIVKFKSTATTSAINAVYRQRGHKLIRRDRFLRHHVIQVKNVKRAMAWYKSHPLVEFAHPNYYCYTSATPNDPLFPTQYGLRQINTPDAWNVTIGSNRVIIAVVDTGIQYNHPDLSTKLLAGYNFVSNNTNWNDDNGHGTHVAGIAGAITNNNIGIAGTSPLCRLLPVKTHNSQGIGTIDNAARGIVYASNRGAHVINMSWSTTAYVEILEQACAYAWNRGSVLIAAAGNSSTNVYNYPAAFTTVIAVAATTSADTKASFSNYGRWVNVAAPGVDIMSTYPTSTYRTLSGTSMSAPFVSGTAALLAAQGRTKLQIVRALQLTADKISGTGVYWIYGRINANRAVRSAFTISRTRRSRVRVSVRLPYAAKKALESRVAARSLQGSGIRIRYQRPLKVRAAHK
ncbi:S8 family peptidase [Alicyclobacillus ferrooxydans]|uniref:S8 family peptidase n=1 Tax=Alicyclobacillus ferrooxydans TaxID=471514 RepID=UPI0006D5B330|nr:S8 family peptidase [Alicyclobacillus ferrooxydans]